MMRSTVKCVRCLSTDRVASVTLMVQRQCASGEPGRPRTEHMMLCHPCWLELQPAITKLKYQFVREGDEPCPTDPEPSPRSSPNGEPSSGAATATPITSPAGA